MPHKQAFLLLGKLRRLELKRVLWDLKARGTGSKNISSGRKPV
jgi:hypothetical protein